MIKATRKAEQDRKRLEMGSAYQSEEEDKLDEESEEETDSYYDEEEEGEEQGEGESQEVVVTLSETGSPARR